MEDWRTLAGFVDDTVNEQFGERVLIVPRVSGDYIGDSRDQNRPEVETVGVYFADNNVTMNLMGDRSGTSFKERVALNNLNISVKDFDVAPAKVRVGDHVVLLDRDLRFEIVKPPITDGTGRSTLALVLLP